MGAEGGRQMNVNRSGNDKNGRNTPSVSQDASQQEESGRPKKSVRNKQEVITVTSHNR